MKTYINISALTLVISLSSCLPPPSNGVARSSFDQPGAQSYASFDIFYQELAPYGTWMDNPQYGQVWIPNVGRGFQPYVTRGHWVMTEYGNTWVSHYDWGWAPFHYGRWYLDNYYGWMWVPGNEWGPAWVAWRSGGGYYGWAPLSPGLNVNVNMNIGRRIPRTYWSFVPQQYFTSPRIYDYCVPRRQVVNVISNTTVINNTYVYNDQHRYYSGPQRRDIERATRRPVAVRRVETSRRPGTASVRGGSVSMYRPEVRSQGVSRGEDVNSSRSRRNTSRNSAPNRSSYERKDRTAPAVRSSRSRDNTTGSQYDSRSSEPAQSTRQRNSPGRASTPSTATPSRSSGNRDYERPSEPARTESRSRSSSPSRSVSPGNSRSEPSRSESSRSSSSNRPSETRSQTRPSETRSAPPTSRSESRSSSSSSRSSSPSSTSSSRSSTTQSAPSPSRSETQTASPSRSSSSPGRSRSGVTRSSRPQR